MQSPILPLQIYAAYGGLAIFLLSTLRFYWYSARLKAIFLGHLRDSPTLDEIQGYLSEVNGECKKFIFTADRRANVILREQVITLVQGSIGGLGASGSGVRWRFNGSLFAVAETSAREWFLANSDVFTKVFAGAHYSIYRVSVSKLASNLL